MTIGLNDLNGCVNASISTSNTAIELLQLASISKDYDTRFVYSVANTASLPAAANNKGRMVYVVDKCGYRYSDGVNWTNDYSQYQNTLWAWGEGCCYRLGDNSIISKSSPVSVVGGYTDWKDVTSGGCFSAGIRADGTMWAWGTIAPTIRGDSQPSTITCGVPIQLNLPASTSNWKCVRAGFNFITAIRCDNTLWGWGCNTYGELGNNDTSKAAVSSPVSVVGGFTDWCKISVGSVNTHGVRANGTLWSWGRNNRGQLGNGISLGNYSYSSNPSPVSVVGGFTDWCNVAAGQLFAAGIRSNGTIWSWGTNNCGQLGDGTTVCRSSPVSVVGGFTDWCQVSASNSTGLMAAIRTNGTLWAWGSSAIGGLGNNNSTGNASSPVSVAGGFTDWCMVSAGSTSAAIRTNGTLWTWGDNISGRIGDGTVVCRSSPVQVSGGFSDWVMVNGGGLNGIMQAIRKVKL